MIVLWWPGPFKSWPPSLLPIMSGSCHSYLTKLQLLATFSNGESWSASQVWRLVSVRNSLQWCWPCLWSQALGFWPFSCKLERAKRQIVPYSGDNMWVNPENILHYWRHQAMWIRLQKFQRRKMNFHWGRGELFLLCQIGWNLLNHTFGNSLFFEWSLVIPTHFLCFSSLLFVDPSIFSMVEKVNIK